MCACTQQPCAEPGDFGWSVGLLTILGPIIRASLVSVFVNEDIRLSFPGDFDSKFYLVLKEGRSCATSTLNSEWPLHGFSPIDISEASWTGFNKSQGPVAICLCHDTVAGLKDPFGSPHEPPAFCEDAANYGVRVGQIFVSGPLSDGNQTFFCVAGSACRLQFKWIALANEDVERRWSNSKIYVQRVSR